MLFMKQLLEKENKKEKVGVSYIFSDIILIRNTRNTHSEQTA